MIYISKIIIIWLALSRNYIKFNKKDNKTNKKATQLTHQKTIGAIFKYLYFFMLPRGADEICRQSRHNKLYISNARHPPLVPFVALA